MKKNIRIYSEVVRSVLIASKQKTISEPVRRAIDTVYTYIEKPMVLKNLELIESPFSTSQRRVRCKLAYVLISFLSFTDFSSFRIGVAKKEHLSPVMHRSIINRYKKITGEDIKRSTYFRIIKKLTNSKYLCSEAMNVVDSNEEGNKVIRGRAGYKWFTSLFFKDLNFKDTYVIEQRRFALGQLVKKKLSNVFPTWFSKTAVTNALTRNRTEAFTTNSTQGQFDTSHQLNLYH